MDEGGPQRRKLLSPTASPRMNLRSTYVDETLGAQPTFQLLEQQPTFEMDNEDSPLILDGQVVARGVGLLNFPRKATFRLRDATLYGYAKGFTGEVAASASLVGSNVCERPDGKIKIDFADGTELTLAPTDATQTKLWLEALKKASMRNIERYYRFGGLLGEGKFGKVHMGYRNETGEPVAIKVMAKSDLNRTQLKNVDREITLATMDMDHPNLVRTFDVFNDNYNVYVVMELMPGGELYNLVDDRGHLSEVESRYIFKQILKGVRYLHNRGVAHRDLKLENVLISSHDINNMAVKVADFGLSGIKLAGGGSKPFQGTYGTPMYIAPEVAAQRPYSAQADMWSCGVMLFVMLSGTFPFPGETIKEVLSKVRRAEYSMDYDEWKDISEDAKDLVRNLLELNAEIRFTPDIALRHPWFRPSCADVEEGLSKSQGDVCNDGGLI